MSEVHTKLYTVERASGWDAFMLWILSPRRGAKHVARRALGTIWKNFDPISAKLYIRTWHGTYRILDKKGNVQAEDSGISPGPMGML